VTVFSFVDTFLVGLVFHNQQSKNEKKNLIYQDEEDNFFCWLKLKGEEKNHNLELKMNAQTFIREIRIA